MRRNGEDEEILEALDPSTPPRDLAYLASKYPKQVLANPVLSFLALSDPEMFVRIDRACRNNLAHEFVDSVCLTVPRDERVKALLGRVAACTGGACDPAELEARFAQRMAEATGPWIMRHAQSVLAALRIATDKWMARSGRADDKRIQIQYTAKLLACAMGQETPYFLRNGGRRGR
jgi:hypothetical protein